jgi:hypothetical protein
VSTASARPVGLQLWSVRERCTHDFAGTLEAVAELGYAGVEHVDSLRYGGLTATEVRRRSDALGLAAAGLHVAIEVLEGDLDRVLDDSAALGAPYVVCAWLPPARRRGADDFHQLAGSLERIGHRCHAAGARCSTTTMTSSCARWTADGPRDHQLRHDARARRPRARRLLADRRGPRPRGRAAGGGGALAARAPQGPDRRAGGRLPGRRGARASHDRGGSRHARPAGILAAASTADWLLVEQDFSASDSLESARISLRNLERLQAS